MLDSNVINWILFEVDPATLSEILNELQIDEISGSPPLTSAIRNENGYQAACLTRVTGNFSARLVSFRSAQDCQGLLNQCIDEICLKLQQRGIGTLQSLLPLHAKQQQWLLRRLGFEARAELCQLCLATSYLRRLPAEAPVFEGSQLKWTDYSQIDRYSWKQLLEQTLLDSQDLRGIGDFTDSAETLDAETIRVLQNSSSTCRVLCNGDQALGLFLLRHMDEKSELVYIGTAQPYRRQRWGSLLLNQAVITAAESGSQYLVTAVDMQNQPARRLFAGLPFVDIGGFQLWERSTDSQSRTTSEW